MANFLAMYPIRSVFPYWTDTALTILASEHCLPCGSTPMESRSGLGNLNLKQLSQTVLAILSIGLHTKIT
jgi:hypothetical protein